MSENKELLKIFGRNLRKLRTEKGLSQRGLFAICGIDNGTLCRMENGRVNATLNTIATLAKALDVPYWMLIKPGEEKIITET